MFYSYHIIDLETPQINCHEDFIKQTDESFPTAMVIWEKPTATDNSGNVSDAICYPSSGNNFTIGQSMVTCESVDGSGNRAACHFNVIVTGNLLCFLYHY